jgi:hypothetical protein
LNRRQPRQSRVGPSSPLSCAGARISVLKTCTIPRARSQKISDGGGTAARMQTVTARLLECSASNTCTSLRCSLLPFVSDILDAIPMACHTCDRGSVAGSVHCTRRSNPCSICTFTTAKSPLASVLNSAGAQATVASRFGKALQARTVVVGRVGGQTSAEEAKSGRRKRIISE